MTRRVQLVPVNEMDVDGHAPARAARGAARRAGVRVVELHDGEALDQAADLYRALWRTDTRAAPVTSDLMRALSHAGSYVVGAYEGERMVAASLAFLASGSGDLHSHITGVLPELQGRDVGSALKLHQRTWALERGLGSVSWTFDPLLRRNAWFNLAKLGVTVVDYLVDFYGPMHDAQNGGDASDRVLAVWDLRGPGALALAAGTRLATEPPLGAAVRLRVDPDGSPEQLALDPCATTVLVQVPSDLQQLRQDRPEVARSWRHAVRDALSPLLCGGWTATTITRDGWYVLEESA